MRRHLDLDLLGRSLPYVRIAAALARLLARVSEYTLDEAAESLADLREAAGAVARTGSAVERLETWYGRVVAGREPRVWPMELAAMAERELASGRRALAVVRMATAAQVASAARLGERHRIDPTDLEPCRDQWEGKLKESDIGRARDRLVIKSWAGELDLLAWLEWGRRAPERRRSIDPLMQARNDLLHTGRGTTPAEFAAAFEGGREYVAGLFDSFGWGRLDEVPSMPTRVQDAVASLADAAWITPPR
jgi:hypothetical protein